MQEQERFETRVRRTDWLWRRSWATAVAVGLLATGCTTTRRATELVVDHHVGMVRGAFDIVSGAAEEREQRLASLREQMEANRAALDVEQDQGRAVQLLKEHVALQDEMIAELLHGSGGHHGGHGSLPEERSSSGGERHEH